MVPRRPERSESDVGVEADRTRAIRLWLLAIALLAFVGRLAAIHLAGMPERYAYDELGYLVLDGQTFDDYEYEGRAWNLVTGGNFWAVRNDGNAPPGFCLWIAGLYAIFGRDVYAPLLGNALLGAVAAVGTFFFARRLLPEGWALVAALGVALDPQLLYWSTRLLTETPSVAVAVALSVALGGALRREGARMAVAAGLAMGLGLAVRNNMIVFFLAYLAWWVWTSGFRDRRREFVLVVAAFALVAVPLFLVVRAHRPPEVQGQFEQMTAGDTMGKIHYLRVATDKAVRENRGPLSPEEEARVLREAEEFIATHSTLRVLLINVTHEFGQFWRVIPTRAGAVETVVYASHAVPLFAFAVLGCLALLLRGDRDTRLVWYMLIAIAGLTALHMMIFAHPRHRMLVQPYLWVFAAGGVRQLALWIGATRHRGTHPVGAGARSAKVVETR